MTLFEEAILACAVTGRWDRAYDLCAYPGDDCGVDHGRKAGERALLLALAAGMHAGTFADQTTAYLDACGEGTGRTKLEAELLKAAFEENRSALEIAFSKYLSFYQKKIFPATDITEKQCRWGTIIWHWMRERGYTIQTAEQWRDYLIRV